MALSGLCTYQNVIDRMADLGLATASDDNADTVELVERKIIEAAGRLELKLTARVQKIISPNQTDAYNNTPAQIVAKITNEGKAFLRICAESFTLQACFREGSTKFRFKYEEAGDAIDKILKDINAVCVSDFEDVFPLLTYDQDGNGTISLMERAFSNTLSSIRVTV